MDRAWLRRMRWRRRGAWMWPSFVALTLADAVIGRLLPPSGDSQTVLGAGLVAAFLLVHLITAFLYGVNPTSPAAILVMAAVLAAVGAVASYIPARRAAKVDPMVALHYE